MDSLAISGIVFACVMAGAVFGLWLRARLPDHHLSSESKDVVKLTMGLIATMTALVLGLLIASAKSAFDAQRNGVSQLAANVILLDRVLAFYGKEAQETRALLRGAVEDVLRQTWPDEPHPAQQPGNGGGPEKLYQELYERIVALAPKNDASAPCKGRH